MKAGLKKKEHARQSCQSLLCDRMACLPLKYGSTRTKEKKVAWEAFSSRQCISWISCCVFSFNRKRRVPLRGSRRHEESATVGESAKTWQANWQLTFRLRQEKRRWHQRESFSPWFFLQILQNKFSSRQEEWRRRQNYKWLAKDSVWLQDWCVSFQWN